MDASPVPVLMLGDPRLREVARPVTDFTEPAFRRDCARLHATLDAFRAEHGFGRGIAAPQIGVPRRLVALCLEHGPVQGRWTLINPEITWRSEETFTLWDDCMSFPWLLVRLARHASVSLRFSDEEGERHRWEKLDRATSELLQHEIDHLDGVLALDHALPASLETDAVISRVAFETRREYFLEEVDSVGDKE